MINISCSSLVKKSAKTICYYRNKKEYVSPNMIVGSDIADLKISSKYKEMRGTFIHGDLSLHYTFDEVKIDNGIKLIEHKSIQNKVEDWYIDYSKIQVALYHSLMMLNPNKKLVTASFYRHNNELNEIEIDKDFESLLIIGDLEYEVKVFNPFKIVNFYLTKAKASLNYHNAEIWDSHWKFKEWEYLNKYIWSNQLILK
jgi:hypothetical protein